MWNNILRVAEPSINLHVTKQVVEGVSIYHYYHHPKKHMTVLPQGRSRFSTSHCFFITTNLPRLVLLNCSSSSSSYTQHKLVQYGAVL